MFRGYESKLVEYKVQNKHVFCNDVNFKTIYSTNTKGTDIEEKIQNETITHVIDNCLAHINLTKDKVNPKP